MWQVTWLRIIELRAQKASVLASRSRSTSGETGEILFHDSEMAHYYYSDSKGPILCKQRKNKSRTQDEVVCLDSFPGSSIHLLSSYLLNQL